MDLLTLIHAIQLILLATLAIIAIVVTGAWVYNTESVSVLRDHLHQWFQRRRRQNLQRTPNPITVFVVLVLMTVIFKVLSFVSPELNTVLMFGAILGLCVFVFLIE